MGNTYNGSRIYNRTYNNHGIGTAQGQSTILQGVNDVNMSTRPRRASSRRGRSSAPEDTPTNPALEGDLPTHADGINSNSDHLRLPPKKFQELVENAATYQLHSSLDPQKPRPPPASNHYTSLSDPNLNPRPGHIYRIWKEDNIVMHLTTVVLVLARGRSWSALKIRRYSQNDRSAATFYEYHSEISEEEPTDTKTESNTRNRASSRLEPLIVSINEKQGLAPDVWVNLENSFHVGQPDDYQVAYCGKLTPKSLEYVVKKHKELYTGG